MALNCKVKLKATDCIIMMIRGVLICLLAVSVVRCQTFCSAYCTNYFSGSGYSPGCTGFANNTCTGCDTRFFFLNGTTCNITSSSYTLEAVEFAPSGTLDGTWNVLNSSNLITTVYNTSYAVLDFAGPAAITKSFTVASPHSAIRFRMFILLSGDPQFTMQLILDGQTANPITVDQSPRLYLSTATNDAYIYTTDEIPHSSGSVTLTIAVTSFTAGSFGIKELMLISKACPANCNGCDSTGACTGCSLVGTTQYYLSKGQCLLYCQNGWYKDQVVLATFPDKCTACNPICLTCDTSSTNCTSCTSTDPSYKFFFNNTCVASCPSGTYYVPTTLICHSCFMGCGSCYASGKDSCYTCGYDPQGNTYVMVAGTTSCELACPPGQFNDTTLFNTCSLCDPKCAVCVINSTYCLSCTTNGTNEAFFFAYNNSCLVTCPTNYTMNTTTHTCVCPNTSYVEIGTQACKPCNLACQTCFGPSLDNCTACYFYYYLLVNSTMCRTSCPSKQYPDDTIRKCRQCDASCYTCSGSSSFCTGCNNGTYLHGSTCLTQCPDGYEKQTAPNRCKLCPQLTYSLNGTCLVVCPAGYGPVGVACISNDIRNRKKASFSVALSIVNSGSRLQILFKFSAPLSPSTNLSYANIMLSIVNSNTNVRLLQTIEQLPLKNVFTNSDNTTLTLMTAIPTSIDSFQKQVLLITFNQQQLFTSNGLLFETYSATVHLNDPLFVSQLYNNYYKSSLDGVGIFMSVVALLIVVAAYWNKKCLFLSFELLLVVQTVRLFNFFKFPLDLSLAAFLRGFDASHFQFLPNVLSLVLTSQQNAFDGYKYKSTDMNFLRLSGSMFEAMLIFGLVAGYLYLYDRRYFQKTFKWLCRFIMYFSCINLFFASWSSFVGLWLNPSNTEPVFVLSQLLGLVAGSLVVIYFYRNRKRTLKEGLFAIASGVNCLLYPFFCLSKPITLILVVFFQGLLILYFCKNFYSKEGRHRCMVLLRCSVLVMLSLVVMVDSSTALIYTLSIILFADVMAVLFVYYRTFRRKLRQKERQATLSGGSGNAQQRILLSNNTFITQENEKPRGDASLPAETIIYEHDVQESPDQHRRPAAEPPAPPKLNLANTANDPDDQIHASTQRLQLDSVMAFGGGRTVYNPTSKRKVRFPMQTFGKDQEESES